MFPGFWQYESTYREQPRVHFTRDVMVSLGGCPSPSAGPGDPDRSWSTFRQHVDLLQQDSTVLPLMVVRRMHMQDVVLLSACCRSRALDV